MRTYRFMRLAAIHPFVSPAKRARSVFDPGYKPKSYPQLPAAGAPTDRAMQANLGQYRVNPGFYPGRHFIPVRL
jgi:hypothetical protein